ncbi:hypothetical protein Droror1_Dr00018261 [Drosera rotundifolia]
MPCGDPWSFKTSTGITEIIVFQGRNIKSISFRDANGLQSGTFGGLNPNDLGEESRIHLNWPLEYVTTITGAYGTFAGLLVITSLSFTTNLSTYGPFGVNSGTSFSIPMEGSAVVGFHGAADHYLDTIGVYVKPAGYLEGIISREPWGNPGLGGGPWKFIASHGRINEIVIHESATKINSISFGDVTGHHSETFGGENPNDTGESKTIRINWPSEHLIGISGSYGTYNELLVVMSLSFITNQTVYGPFGNTSAAHSFAMPMIPGLVIVGFQGRAGYYLDAIGVYQKSINSI